MSWDAKASIFAGAGMTIILCLGVIGGLCCFGWKVFFG